MASSTSEGNPDWPALPYAEWKDTLATLHMWTQIVGKIRLVQSPWVNHSWHVTLYVTAQGLATSPIPYRASTFEIEFDFVTHMLRIATSEARATTMPLKPRTVADFYREVMAALGELGVPVQIRTRPNEVENAIPFDQDQQHRCYDSGYAHRCWRAMVQADRVFKKFRAGFIGKASPVHFFWGGFDLAATRFSGAPAPPHPGGVPNCPDWVQREAYSHEVSSCGFWPGTDALPEPVFYSYAYPEPPGFKTAHVAPAQAAYHSTFGEFILPYDVVRQADSPDEVLLEFLQSTYDAAADLGRWNRAALERKLP
ncbi:MAG: DUF5996 family protein [Telluria sp.]